MQFNKSMILESILPNFFPFRHIFFIFTFKLGNFILNTIFSFVTNNEDEDIFTRTHFKRNLTHCDVTVTPN